MCGIAGFCIRREIKDLDHVLKGMTQEIHHRGPDAEGYCLYDSPANGRIGFGHKRLSIIDLSMKGRQPMDSVSKKVSIIFNGEIYNYRILRKQLEEEGVRFKTSTDTEVILNMYEKYGENCLQYFNGMFAFAIYDRSKDHIFVARDRLGIRPLYYYSETGTFVFASEVKALLKFPLVPKTANYSTIFQYVQCRYVKNPETIFQGIQKLEPGHYMIVKNSQTEIRRYWDVEDFNKINEGGLKDCINRLKQVMENSVKIRMISDVPFGAFLSGGLDSSLVVAMMSKFSHQRINTFSVGFNDQKHSELPYARVISDYLKTNHHELIITPKEIMDNLYSAVWHRDAPVSETADIPMMLLAKEAKKYVSVILTGEGSDEVFGGYPKYAYDHFSKFFLFKQLLHRDVFRKAIDRLPYRYRKVKSAFNTLCEENDLIRYDNWFSSYRKDKVNDLLASDFQQEFSPFMKRAAIPKGITNLDRMLYYDQKYWLSDNLLERGDKMLMSGSIEGRVPFLDYNVVELGFRLPDQYKIKHFNRKYIVKKLAESYIPSEIINRKKVGFYIPVGDWFRNDLKEYVQDHLLSSQFKQRGIFNNKEVTRIVEAHCKGTMNYEKELWMLLNLEIWFRVFVDGGIR